MHVSRCPSSSCCYRCINTVPVELTVYCAGKHCWVWVAKRCWVWVAKHCWVWVAKRCWVWVAVFRSSYSLQRIPPAVQSPLSPVTLGLYKGTYGSHGVEIVNVTVSDEYQILGDKILVSAVKYSVLYHTVQIYCPHGNVH